MALPAKENFVKIESEAMAIIGQYEEIRDEDTFLRQETVNGKLRRAFLTVRKLVQEKKELEDMIATMDGAIAELTEEVIKLKGKSKNVKPLEVPDSAVEDYSPGGALNPTDDVSVSEEKGKSGK